MFKNLSIRQLSFIITAIVVFINSAIVLLFSNLSFAGGSPIFLVLAILVAGFVIYTLVRYLLEKFVFRKIKLIYKIIHDSKINKSNFDANELNSKSISEVNDEVIEWAETTEKQIKTLKTLEMYRKNFVGNISHELKTPIFSIQGYLHTLLDGGMYDENININYLKRAANNAERLQTIVEDLEEISKLESGKLILDVQRFDIKGLIKEIIEDLKMQSREKGISITFKPGADQSFNVLADKETIRQVLNNLITNSLKYGKDGGKTVVSIYDIHQNVLVEITDDGIGIDEEHLKHVFDRFYRVDSSRSRAQGGSGLGLSIVKHIIEAHNQTINVRSTPGVGSTFGFTLKKAT